MEPRPSVNSQNPKSLTRIHHQILNSLKTSIIPPPTPSLIEDNGILRTVSFYKIYVFLLQRKIYRDGEEERKACLAPYSPHPTHYSKHSVHSCGLIQATKIMAYIKEILGRRHFANSALLKKKFTYASLKYLNSYSKMDLECSSRQNSGTHYLEHTKGSHNRRRFSFHETYKM